MSQPGVTFHTPTGDYRVDALLNAAFGAGKWGGPQGTGVTLTYATKGPGSTYIQNYSPLLEPERGQDLIPTDAQEVGFRTAIQTWGSVANINFVEIEETANQTADIRFAMSRSVDAQEFEEDFSFDLFAYAYLPFNSPVAGDIWFDPDLVDFDYTPNTHGSGYYLMLHELGHALFGFEDITDNPGINGVTLSEGESFHAFSIMSYLSTPGVYGDPRQANVSFPTTPMLYDILAAQALYGPNMSHNATDTVYQFAPGQAIYQTIWDAGGIDTIDWSNQETAAFINLNDGSFSNMGPPRSNGTDEFPETLAIAFNAIIENAKGGTGNDTIVGNAADNIVYGGLGIDLVTGFNGNDLIYGNQGTDTIYGNLDLDRLYGGQDADRLYGGQQSDVLYGNFANDVLYGNFDNDFMFGGQDQDTLYGGQGNDIMFGNLGNDVLFGNKDHDQLLGNDGDDILYGGAGNDGLDGGAGNDEISGDAGNDTAYGGDGADDIYGGIDDDVLYGGSGNDIIEGGDDDDRLFGQEGDDQLRGGEGSDYLYGGSGADQMIGGSGNDTYVVSNLTQTVSEQANSGVDVIETQVDFTLPENVEIGLITGPNNVSLTGNNGNNSLTGNIQDNLIIGGAGNDTILGSAGADTLDGTSGTNLLQGGFGNDVYILRSVADVIVEDADGGFDTVITTFNTTIADNIEVLVLSGSANEATGNDGDNQLTGSTGTDLISGRGGNDTLIGNAGADTLVGGAGDDVLTGGGGADRFAYSGTGLGNDTIMDYEAGLDIITVNNGLTVVGIADDAGNAEVTLSSGDLITVVGVSSGNIEVVDLTAPTT